MTFEGDREARFEDPDFDPDAYLASVVDLGSKPPPESAPFAFAASARDAFAAARDRLGSHAAAAARRAADLAAVASAENDVFLSRVGDVATDAVTLEATLDALHERVDRVAVVARDAGEALRRAESRRVAADDAVRLARHLVAFDACRVRERLRFAVDPVFFDEARAAEAAPLARRLLALATDTREAVVGAVANRSRVRRRNPAHEPPGATAPTTVSRDGANENKNKNAQTFLANARDALEWYCDALETRLLRTFEDAERGGDDAAATDAAAALETFGRGGSLARRFVATRPMFTRAASLAPTDSPVAADGEDPSSGRESYAFAAIVGARGARDAAARAVSALRDAFESIKDDTVAETRRARALFPEGPAFERAVAALTHRVVEQSVGDALDAALGAAPPPAPAFEPGKDETTSKEKERKERTVGSQEAPLRNAGAQSAPVSPLKPSAPRTRHRRAASVSVATMSWMGAAADARTNGLVSFATTDDTEDTEDTERVTDTDALHSSLSRDHVRSESDGETSDETRSDEDASRPRLVRDAPRAFALAAYLAALAEAHALARRLASDLRAGTRGAVRVADALDALLAARRAGYDEMETACLRGLVAARADSAATDGDDGFLFFGEEETETTDRKRDHSPDEKHVVEEARLAARERAVLLDIARWFDAAAKRVDAVFAPPFASRDEESRREGTDAVVDAIVDASDASSEEGKKAISARAIATATSLASAAAAEHRIAEIAFTEMARVASATTKRASALCALRARRLPPATKEEAADDATRRAAAAADACLGAACAAADAVAEAASAARDVAQSRAAAAADRVASASGAMVGGGDVAASAAAAARATADAAARATASAAAKFESRAGAAASRCVRAALDVFFGVFGAEIKAKMCGKKIRERYAFDFADAAAAAADPSFFPGQHASDACASALARLRRAAEALDSLASSRGAGRGAEETRAALMRELSSRALVAIKGHFFELGRFAYSAAGALQLKRDLGEFEAWAVSVSSTVSDVRGRDARESEKLQDANAVGSAVAAALRDEIQKQWRDTLEACDVLLVSPDALPGLLKQRTAESAKAFSGGDEYAAENVALSPRRIVSLRVDFHPSMVEGLGPALAEKHDSGAARHARSGSLSSAFFASFGRTHSPPPTQ